MRPRPVKAKNGNTCCAANGGKASAATSGSDAFDGLGLDPEEEARLEEVIAEVTDPAIRRGFIPPSPKVSRSDDAAGAEPRKHPRCFEAGFCGLPHSMAVINQIAISWADARHARRCLRRVEYIIKILGLQRCADTVVGNAMVRGVSGGEKKRVTTGEILVGTARVLLMDEISTGAYRMTSIMTSAGNRLQANPANEEQHHVCARRTLTLGLIFQLYIPNSNPGFCPRAWLPCNC